jgi:hypothetical protein
MAGHARRSRRIGARIAVAVSVVGLALGVGVAAGFADPGNGNGNPNPPGHSDPPGNGQGAAGNHAISGTGGTFGSPTSAQPLQHPDNQGHGANTFPGPYSSTRDGSPSLNGNGNGQAVGKPCAGCVGRADNKNPPGQFPDGSDANAGYECDTNHGIGRTNPAHTGCQAVPPQPPAVPVTPVVTPPAPAAPLVSGVPVPSVSVPTARALPVTGGRLLYPLVMGLAALAVGAALTFIGRRKLTSA